MCVNVFLAYMCFYHMHTGVHGSQQKASDPLGLIIDICDTPDLTSWNQIQVSLKNSEYS